MPSSPSRKYVVGLVGHKGSGKDALCKVIQKHLPGAVRLAFADALKVEVYDALSGEASPQDVSDLIRLSHKTDTDIRLFWPPKEVGREQKLEYIDLHKVALRKMLQEWGTELRRDREFGYWIRKLDVRLREVDTDLVIVTDVRFPDEGTYVRSNAGVLVRVVRDGQINEDSHRSEQYAREATCSYTLINPGTTLEALEEAAGGLLTYLRGWRSLRGL